MGRRHSAGKRRRLLLLAGLLQRHVDGDRHPRRGGGSRVRRLRPRGQRAVRRLPSAAASFLCFRRHGPPSRRCSGDRRIDQVQFVFGAALIATCVAGDVVVLRGSHGLRG
jgi:hypothetical protein